MKKIICIPMVLLALILFSCKEKINPNENEPETKKLKMLFLDPLKKAYYNNQNQRYLQIAFKSDTTEYFYGIVAESGKKYRILIYGTYMESIYLDLSDEDTNFIATGQQADVGLSSKYIVYEPQKTDTVIISVATDNQNNVGIPFYLTVEEIGTYELQWKNRTWICDGDWTVNSDGNLMFKGFNSGFSKWIMLKNSDLKNFTATVEFNSNSETLATFIGIAFNASSEIFDMLNLPANSCQFKISGTNDWEFWWISMQKSISREIGVFTNDINVGLNNFKIENYESIKCHVNDSLCYEPINCNTGFNELFITIEDKNADEFVFTDFVIE